MCVMRGPPVCGHVPTTTNTAGLTPGFDLGADILLLPLQYVFSIQNQHPPTAIFNRLRRGCPGEKDKHKQRPKDTIVNQRPEPTRLRPPRTPKALCTWMLNQGDLQPLSPRLQHHHGPTSHVRSPYHQKVACPFSTISDELFFVFCTQTSPCLRGKGQDDVLTCDPGLLIAFGARPANSRTPTTPENWPHSTGRLPIDTHCKHSYQVVCLTPQEDCRIDMHCKHSYQVVCLTPQEDCRIDMHCKHSYQIVCLTPQEDCRSIHTVSIPIIIKLCASLHRKIAVSIRTVSGSRKPKKDHGRLVRSQEKLGLEEQSDWKQSS
ncbi:hypothetical protein ElyMa_005981700 [Elysia marginata]|uniref:Uncharacterized protein n=1 Tax=Elysia marginata TaxID=1093978 RepID=A0AAV4GDW3_9GAST|nr:hypothetical protein ElyMa_005981700 [Elysia marginata]